MSQVENISNILRRDGMIDNFYAIQNKISYRLAARINDLRRRGWKIRTVGDEKNCVYYLESEPTTPPKVPERFKREVIGTQLGLRF